MNGSRTVMTPISVCRSFPTLRLAATWLLTCGSHPPRAVSMAKVISSRTGTPIPSRVR
jgi:hypothetical protein